MLFLFLSFIFLCVAFTCFLLAVNDWDYNKAFYDRTESVTYDFDENFNRVSIDSDTEDIMFLESESDKCKVICDETEKEKFTVTVTDDCLSIQKYNGGKWYDNITLFSFGNRSVKVYLPKTNYNSLVINEDTGNISVPKDFIFRDVDITVSTGNVDCGASSSGRISIKTSTGNIYLKKLSAKKLDLSTSTGYVALTSVDCSGEIGLSVTTGSADFNSVTCNTLNSTGDTGRIFLSDSVVKGKITIERSTGNIKFEHSDAGELEITTDTGDVTGTLLTGKVFIARSDTGRIDVPETVAGGKCKITTDTGDISLKIEDNRVPSTDLPDESETAIEENLFTSTKPEL